MGYHVPGAGHPDTFALEAAGGGALRRRGPDGQVRPPAAFSGRHRQGAGGQRQLPEGNRSVCLPDMATALPDGDAHELDALLLEQLASTAKS